MTPPLHPREPERLAALRRYNILDTEAEPFFDDITRLIAAVCKAPIAVISFVDGTRQWFKSEVGLAARETPLDVSICAYAIQQPGLFIVPDTRKDGRFAGNPLVAGAPHLRFYAGAPLETPEGLPLGTLCVLDVEPRTLTSEQQATLLLLARTVMTQLELRRAQARNEEILESIGDAFYALDREWRFVYVNRKAEGLWHRSREELLGRVMWQVFPDAVGTGPYHAHHQAMAEQRPVVLETVSATLGVPIDLNIFPSPSGVSVYFRDISARKRTENERTSLSSQKDLQMQEMNHRIKNSLQLVSSMLSLQAKDLTDQGARRVLDNARARVGAIALVHEKLYSSAVPNRINFAVYLRDLCADLERALCAAHRACSVKLVAADALILPPDSVVPLALVVNELVTNAVKYAYPDKAKDATVTIALRVAADGEITLAVGDGGIGLPPEFDPGKSRGLGMVLVTALVRQIRGTLHILRGNPGTEFRVTLRLPEAAQEAVAA